MNDRNGGPSQREWIEAQIARQAARQHGVFSRADALALGATSRIICRRVEAGRWDRIHPNVFRIAGTTPTWRQSVIAACLALGGVASHRTAGVLWGFPHLREKSVEIIVRRGKRRPLGDVVIHELPLLRSDITTNDGIQVTTPIRTVLDLGAVMKVALLGEIVDDTLRRELASVDRLRERLEERAERGRPGVRALREVLDERDPAARVPDSVFESRFFRLLKSGAMPSPVPQFDVIADGRFVMRLDYAYPDLRVGIETDSWRHHSGRAAWERDFSKRDEMLLQRWLIIHITWQQMVMQPARVMDKVRRARALAAARTNPHSR